MAQRRLNKKVVATLTIIVMTAILVLMLVILGRLGQRDPAPYVEMARKYRAEGNYEKAIEQFQYAYRLSGDRIELLLEAGQTAWEGGDLRTAMQLYRQVLLIQKGSKEAHRLYVDGLAKICELSNDAEQAKRLLEASEELLTVDPESPLGHYARGSALLMLVGEDAANAEAGEKALKRAIELSPGEPDYVDALASYYVREDRTDDARLLYQNLLKDPQGAQKAPSYISYAAFLIGRDEPDAARAQLRTAQAAHPDDAEVQLAIGRYHLSQDQLEEAAAALNKALELDPNLLSAHLALGTLYRLTDRPDEALATFKRGLATPETVPGVESYRRRRQRFALLYQCASTALAMSIRPDVDKDALIAQANGYLDEALSLLPGETPRTHLLRAMIQERQGKPHDAMQSLERADRLSRGIDPQVKFSLANLYASFRQDSRAVEAYRQGLAAVPGNVDARLRLAAVYLRLLQATDAIAQADDVLKRQPDNRRALEIKADAYRQLRQADKVQEMLRLIQALGGGTSVENLLLDARTLLLQRKTDLAEEKLLEALKLQPADRQVVQLLVQIYLAQNQRDQARAVAAAAVAADPDSEDLQELLIIADEEDPAQRDEKILALLRATTQPVLRAQRLVNFHLPRGQLAEAATHLDELLRLRPDDRNILERRFVVALQQEDWDRAGELAGRAAELNADGADGAFYAGRLLLAQKQHEEAAARLEAALQKFPSYSQGLVWLGQTYLGMGNLTQAREAGEAALEFSSNNGHAHKLLAQVGQRQRDPKLYGEHLVQAMRFIPKDPWVAREYQQRLEEADPERGIERRKAQREKDPDDIDNLLRLGRLYLLTKDTAAAEECYRKAAELAPEHLGVAMQLADFLLVTGRPTEGEALLSDLVRKQTTDKDRAAVEVLLARYYRKQGGEQGLSKADKAYRIADGLSPSPALRFEIAEFCAATGRPNEAIAWYRKALPADSKFQENRIRSRLIAVLLATQAFDAAATEVAEYRKRFPDDVEGLIYRGVLEARQGKVDEAIKTFSLVLERRPDSIRALYQRGRLYAVSGGAEEGLLTQAAADLRRARDLNPGAFNYTHRIALAEVLERMGQVDAAVLELRSVLEDDDQAVNAAQALAQMLARHKRWSDLERYVAAPLERKQPNNWLWPLWRGLVGVETQDAAKAVDGFTRAARVSTFQVEPVRQLLRFWRSRQQYAKVVDYVTNTVPPDRWHPLVRLALAEAYAKLNQPDKAREQCDLAIAQAAASGQSQLYRQVVTGMAQILGLKESIARLRQRLKVNANDDLARLVLPDLLASDQQYDEAVRIASDLAERLTDPQKKSMVLKSLGLILYGAGRYEEAVRRYEQVLEIERDSQFALNNLAYMLAEDLDRPKDALEYAVRAARLAPGVANVQDTLGWTQHLLKDHQAALGTLLHAKDLDSQNLAVRYHLARVYAATGDKAAAMKELREARQIMAGSPAVAGDFGPKIEAFLKELEG